MIHQPTNAWNTIFQQEGKVFTTPHEDMPKFVDMVTRNNGHAILDLGCGSGRHVLYLTQHGFWVCGLDNSPEGLELTRQWLHQEALSADLRHHQMTDPFPYADASFDAVLSIQVIHHARIAETRQIIAEIARVLKPEGIIFISVPQEKHQGVPQQKIEPGTYIPLDGWERGLPHHYFTEPELHDVFSAFSLKDIYCDSTRHYCVWGTKKEVFT